MRLEAAGVGVRCSCDLFEYNRASQLTCVWSCLWVHTIVSAHICVSRTLLRASFYWLPIDPVPINKSLFDLCLTICVPPNSQQTNRARGPLLSVSPKSFGKRTNSLNKFFMNSHLWYRALLYITLRVFSETRHSCEKAKNSLSTT